jgi:hypothetical protein
MQAVKKAGVGCSFSKLSEHKENRFDDPTPGPGSYLDYSAPNIIPSKASSSFCSNVPICTSVRAKNVDTPGPGQYSNDTQDKSNAANSENYVHSVKYPFQSTIERKVYTLIRISGHIR